LHHLHGFFDTGVHCCLPWFSLVAAAQQAEGKLEAKLHEMYRWGKQYGWEPVVHVNGMPQPPAGPGVVGLAPPVI
jgi:hypothetical protein